MPSKKKKFNSRFPPARIKKIMQTDEDVGKVAAAVPVIISRSLEMFIQSLILKAGETTMSRNAKTLTTSHIKQTIESEKKFDFLRDLVANIPDHQPEEDGETSKPERVKGRVGRPRKNKDGDETTSKPRRRKERQKSSESSDANENENEEDSSTESDNGAEDDDNHEEKLNNNYQNNYSPETAMRIPPPNYPMGMPPFNPAMGVHPMNSNMGAMPPPPLPGYNMMPHLSQMPGIPPPYAAMGYPPYDRMPYPIPNLSHPSFSNIPSSSGVQATTSQQSSCQQPSTTDDDDYDT
ncbi:hypothetical protein SNE40_008748 [Patella caerulea]|uniref:Dr1-associated corepressor n=1 Tax=Patella caerulea TaxID=87958 RepID=A0AAN8JTQ0_PATCE